MPLSGDLQTVIDKAHGTVLSDPKHILMPFYREMIYQAIRAVSGDHAKVVRGWLAVVTAEHVLHRWQDEFPHNALPAHMLEIGRALLFSEIGAEAASAIAAQGWSQIEQAADSVSNGVPSVRGYNAGMAAVQALYEALGINPFESLDVNQNITNSDLDPGTTDTAEYAAVAYAGRENWEQFDPSRGNPPSSPEERKAYWEWWLKEAIPLAWARATQGTTQT